MTLEQRYGQRRRIFAHDPVAAAGGSDELGRPFDCALQQDQLKPRISLPDGNQPSGSEGCIEPAAAIGPACGKSCLLGRPYDIAGFGQRQEEGFDLLGGDIVTTAAPLSEPLLPFDNQLIHPKLPGKQKAAPPGAAPAESLFFTVPNLCQMSVTMSSIIYQIGWHGLLASGSMPLTFGR